MSPQNLLPIPDFKSSTAPTPEQVAEYERYVAEQQVNDPLWKKLGRGALGVTAGAFKGLFGLEPPPGLIQNNPEVAGNVFSQILDAGLPFLSITKGKQVYHGTRKIFERFDPSKYDVDDVLGWMTHFAENPSYANDYASGISKGAYGYGKANMIAAKPQAQNTLDLVNPNPDDIAAALAAVPEWHRKELLSVFKDTRRQVREGGDKYRYLGERHYRDEGYPEDAQLPIQSVAEKLRMGAEDFDKSLFDAIRYRDMGHVSWAIPEKTPIQTAWGLPMTNDPKPLSMLKLPHTAPIKSELQTAPKSILDVHSSTWKPKPKAKGQYDYSSGGEMPAPYWSKKEPNDIPVEFKLSTKDWELANQLKKAYVDDWPELPNHVTEGDLAYLHAHNALSLDEFNVLKNKVNIPSTQAKLDEWLKSGAITPEEYAKYTKNPPQNPTGKAGFYYIDKDNPKLPTIFGKPVNEKALDALYVEGLVDGDGYNLLKGKFFPNKKSSNLIYVSKDNPELPVIKGKPVNGKELKDLYFDGQLDSADYKLLKEKFFSADQAEAQAKVIEDAIKNKASLGPMTEEALNKIVVFDTMKKSGISAVFDDLVDALDYMDAHPGTDWNTVKAYMHYGYK